MKTNTFLLFLLVNIIYGHAQNPIVQTWFTPDPAPMVYNDTVYLYTGRDDDGASYFEMNKWQVYSSVDMVNWTDHGTPLTFEDFTWTLPNSAWAAQCIERNGKFYWYVCCEYPGKWHTVGVAVSDSPTGPFRDAIGAPLFITGEMGEIDPSVFIDDDGQAYLYWGNGRLSYVLLNEDMISYDESVGIVQVIPRSAYDDLDNVPQQYVDAFGPKFEEGPWFYKRNDIYYMLYAAGGVPEDISYSTAPTATGPWTYQGKIMPVTDANRAFTNHCGVIDYKGNSYFFYHTGTLPGGGGFNRSTCIEQFTYNVDGTIPQITITDAGVVNGVAKLNPYTRTEGETIAWSAGLKTETNNETGVYVTQIQNGDYLKVRDVDFGTPGAGVFTASVASGSNGGSIEIRVDALDGTVIGILPISNTGGWSEWQNKSTNINGMTGTHDLYLIFKGSELEEQLFNLDYWQFAEKNTKELSAINASIGKYKIDKIAGINTANYTVTAIYADGTSEDITLQAALTPNQANIISYNNGVITGLNYGEVEVEVSFGGKSDIIKVLVKELETEVTLKSLSIDIENPADVNLLRGNSLAYVVTAEFMDGSTLDVSKVATYSNSNENAVAIADGTIKALNDGTANIEISYKGELGATFTVDVNVMVETFPLSVAKGFSPTIWADGTFDENTLTLITGQYGFGGWIYDDGIDLSSYKYLVVELAEKQNCGASFNIFDENNYWSAACTNSIGDNTRLVIDLHNMKEGDNKDGDVCDPSHIYIMGFWSFGGSPIKISRIFLSNDGNVPASVESVFIDLDENNIVDVYTIMGTRVRSQVAFKDAMTGLSPGIYIVGNKKIMITN